MNKVISYVLLTYCVVHLSAQQSEIQNLLEHPEDHAMVIKNGCFPLYQVSMDMQELTVSFMQDGKEVVLKGSYTKGQWKIDRNDHDYTVNFHPDGTAESDAGLHIVAGKDLKWEEAKKILKEKKVLKLTNLLIDKNKVAAENALCWHFINGTESMQLTFVFPDGFDDPEFGEQQKVRVFKYKPLLDQWTAFEEQYQN